MATDRRALAWRFLHGGLLALFALFCCLRAAPVTAAPAAEPTPSAVYGNAPALPPQPPEKELDKVKEPPNKHRSREREER